MDFFNYLKDNKLFVLIISLVINVILVVLSSIFVYKCYSFECDNDTNERLTFASNEDDKTQKIYVEVKGAVKKAGVFEVDDNAIINDLIKLSGGFKSNAWTNNINLSKKVANEMVIYVFTQSEYKNINKNKTTFGNKSASSASITPSQDVCECPTYNIANCVENGISEIITGEKETVFTKPSEERNEIKENTSTNTENNNNLININTASKEELMTLPGIGSSKAEDIINYRNTNGYFTKIQDITNVSGIGSALYEKIKDLITV